MPAAPPAADHQVCREPPSWHAGGKLQRRPAHVCHSWPWHWCGSSLQQLPERNRTGGSIFHVAESAPQRSYRRSVPLPRHSAHMSWCHPEQLATAVHGNTITAENPRPAECLRYTIRMNASEVGGQEAQMARQMPERSSSPCPPLAALAPRQPCRYCRVLAPPLT